MPEIADFQIEVFVHSDGKGNIADIEHRHSMSNTVVAIVERQLSTMPEEWRQTGTINLPKSRKRKDIQDVENILLNPE